jgi:N,N'-diacetyl-8-epilegionaminate cytidylyltransferase
MKQYIVGFIFARGGSQGVPGKNIRFLAGKPLIAYAIETAFQSEFINRVIVSTDDEKIAQVAQAFGAEVPFIRPKELAQNNSPEWMAWQHAIQTLKEQDNGRELDVFVSVPPTAPLRTTEDVDNAIQTFLASDADIVITSKKASCHPSFNMITLDELNCAKLVLPLDKQIIRRQDAPPVYDMTTVAYVASPKFIMESKAVFEGRVKALIIPEERALDIDTELDFQFAEYLMRNRMKRK